MPDGPNHINGGASDQGPAEGVADEVVKQGRTAQADGQPAALGGSSYSEAAAASEVTITDRSVDSSLAAKLHRPSVTEPQFEDERVLTFYRESSVQGIDYTKLASLLKAVFNFNDTELDKAIVLLEGHAHLSEDYARDIAEAVQRSLDKDPPRADRNADVILRYDVFVKQGASEETRSALYRWLKDGGMIGEIRPYAVEGKMTVPRVKVRKLNYRSAHKLKNHKLKEKIRQIFKALDVDMDQLFSDFFGDQNIPQKIKRGLLYQLKLRYEPANTTSKFWREDKAFRLSKHPSGLVNFLSALIEGFGHKALTTKGAQDAYGKYLTNLLLRYFSEKFPHFVERIEGMRQELEQDTAWSYNTARIKKFYQHAREFFVNGIPHYSLNAVLPAVKSLLLSLIPREKGVRKKLLKWGESVPDEPLTQEWLAERAAWYQGEARRLNAEGKRKNASQMQSKHDYLHSIDLSVEQKIKDTSEWSELSKLVVTLLSDDRHRQVHARLKYFTMQYDHFKKALDSFGKYFEEIPSEELPYEITLVPVKGLAAGVAIDSGSDCGQGRQLTRMVADAYTTFLLTDDERARLWGYDGSFEVDSDQDFLLQTDAMNPSEQLELNGGVFLEQRQGHMEEMTRASQKKGEPIKAFLISSTANLVSNTAALSNAVTQLSLPRTGQTFKDTKARLPSRGEPKPDFVARWTSSQQTAPGSAANQVFEPGGNDFTPKEILELFRDIGIGLFTKKENGQSILDDSRDNYQATLDRLGKLLSQAANEVTYGLGAIDELIREYKEDFHEEMGFSMSNDELAVFIEEIIGIDPSLFARLQEFLELAKRFSSELLATKIGPLDNEKFVNSVLNGTDFATAYLGWKSYIENLDDFERIEELARQLLEDGVGYIFDDSVFESIVEMMNTSWEEAGIMAELESARESVIDIRDNPAWRGEEEEAMIRQADPYSSVIFYQPTDDISDPELRSKKGGDLSGLPRGPVAHRMDNPRVLGTVPQVDSVSVGAHGGFSRKSRRRVSAEVQAHSRGELSNIQNQAADPSAMFYGARSMLTTRVQGIVSLEPEPLSMDSGNLAVELIQPPLIKDSLEAEKNFRIVEEKKKNEVQPNLKLIGGGASTVLSNKTAKKDVYDLMETRGYARQARILRRAVGHRISRGIEQRLRRALGHGSRAAVMRTVQQLTSSRGTSPMKAGVHMLMGARVMTAGPMMMKMAPMLVI